MKLYMYMAMDWVNVLKEFLLKISVVQNFFQNINVLKDTIILLLSSFHSIIGLLHDTHKFI